MSPAWAIQPKKRCDTTRQDQLGAATAADTAADNKDYQLALVTCMLDQLCEHDFAHIFTEPIPVDEIPGYSLVVSRPMDLGTVRKGLSDDGWMDAPHLTDVHCLHALC